MSLSLQFIIINVRGQDQPWTASIQYEYQYNSINIQYFLDGCSLGISSGFSFIHVITRSWLEYDEMVLHLNNGGPCTPIDHHIMRYNHNQFAAIFTAKTQFVVC